MGSFLEIFYYTISVYEEAPKKTDFCDCCCSLKTIIHDKKSTSNEKEEATLKLKTHLELVVKARTCYNDERFNMAKEDTKTILYFDHAENLQLPMLRETPGSFYFKTRRGLSLV